MKYEELEEVINRQKVEIERLTEEKWQAQDDLDNYHAMYQEEVKANAELQKQVDELKERAKIDLENEKNWGKIQTKQAVKDTVKKYHNALRKQAHYSWLSDFHEFMQILAKIEKKEFGVEVE